MSIPRSSATMRTPTSVPAHPKLMSCPELEPDVALGVPLLFEHTIQVIQKRLQRVADGHRLVEKIGRYRVCISEVMHHDNLFELQELNLRMRPTEALGRCREFFAFNRSKSVY